MQVDVIIASVTTLGASFTLFGLVDGVLTARRLLERQRERARAGRVVSHEFGELVHLVPRDNQELAAAVSALQSKVREAFGIAPNTWNDWDPTGETAKVRVNRELLKGVQADFGWVAIGTCLGLVAAVWSLALP